MPECKLDVIMPLGVIFVSVMRRRLSQLRRVEETMSVVCERSGIRDTSAACFYYCLNGPVWVCTLRQFCLNLITIPRCRVVRRASHRRGTLEGALLSSCKGGEIL